ncbi:hypothetical protein BD289DRAFT_423793 [Coniella lustricola]|uniref:Uncharacterized protein n=1 Tax=Coniella lustricola TaxID=2025994 RepID=A0A2T3AJ27_9PEZI|nr:hypothetical protein BD289DRAFT_423793 [Coniella lustricola]
MYLPRLRLKPLEDSANNNNNYQTGHDDTRIPVSRSCTFVSTYVKHKLILKYPTSRLSFQHTLTDV